MSFNYKFVVYPGNNSFVIREALLKRGNWKEVQYDDPDLNLADIDFIWSPNNLTTKDYDKIVETEKKKNSRRIVINHFENNSSLTTKSDMIKALSKHYKKNPEAQKGGYNVFHSIPASYVLVVGVNNVELRDFQIIFNEISKQNYKRCCLPEKHCSSNVWILKPENQSQGKGIEIFQNLKSILSFLHYKPPFSNWVIQKYIERPLLYNGRKFDLRLWVLFTNKGELFVYKNGYLRTSSSKYSMNTFNDAVHLTNWSLQKGLGSYEKHEKGNRLSLKEGLQYIFDTQYSKYNVDYEKDIYPRIIDLIIDLIRSCETEMFQSKKLNNCFELYGFDFIIDDDLRVWLIEANRNPGFGLPTEKARNLIDEMVDEMLKITIDNIFPPRAALEPRQGVFDLVYTMKPSPLNRFLPKNDRRSFNLNVYPIPELEPQVSHGEKRYQVLNPITEKEMNTQIERKKKQENDFMKQYKSQTYTTQNSDLFSIKKDEEVSIKNNPENKIQSTLPEEISQTNLQNLRHSSENHSSHQSGNFLNLDILHKLQQQTLNLFYEQEDIQNTNQENIKSDQYQDKVFTTINQNSKEQERKDSNHILEDYNKHQNADAINDFEFEKYHKLGQENDNPLYHQKGKSPLKKPKSRGDLFQKLEKQLLFDGHKQLSLDFDKYVLNQIQSPTSNSQPVIPQRISSIILGSPRVLNPIQTSTQKIDSQRELENNTKKEDSQRQFYQTSSTAMQSSKIILEPINSIKSQKLQKKQVTSIEVDYIKQQQPRNSSVNNNDYFSQLQSPSNMNATSTYNLFNKFNDKNQYWNKSYSRSLQIKQRNEQLAQKSPVHTNLIKMNQTKSQSSATWIQPKEEICTIVNHRQQISDSRLPVVSQSVHSRNNNDIKQIQNTEKQMIGPYINYPLTLQENQFFQKQNSIPSRLPFKNKI